MAPFIHCMLNNGDNMSLDASTTSITTMGIESSSTNTVLTATVPLVEKRRCSNISFEKHAMFLSEAILDFSDDEDSEDEDDEEEEKPMTPRKVTQTLINPQEDVLRNLEICGPFRKSFCKADRRTSEISIYLDDLMMDDDEGCKEVGMENFRRSSSSFLGKIQDEIVAKGIADGKLIATADSTESSHCSWSSGSSLSSRICFARSASHAGGNDIRCTQDVLRQEEQCSYESDRESLSFGDTGTGAGGSIRVTETVISVPPPLGAQPRRSSFKRRRVITNTSRCA